VLLHPLGSTQERFGLAQQVVDELLRSRLKAQEEAGEVEGGKSSAHQTPNGNTTAVQQLKNFHGTTNRSGMFWTPQLFAHVQSNEERFFGAKSIYSV